MIGPFGLAPKATVRERALPLARALARMGHAVSIVMAPWHTPEETERTWDEDGVRLAYVGLGLHLPLLQHLVIACRLVRGSLSWRPDVVHCFKPKGHSGLAALFLWCLQRLGLVRLRLVVDEDDWEGPGGWNALEGYSAPVRALFAWQERWGLRHSQAVTVASRALETLAWSLGVAPERVIYLPNGAVAPFKGDGLGVRERLGLGGVPVILLYTRFFEYDVARVVEAVVQIRSEVPEVRLLVVGEGLYPEDEARFDVLVEATGLAPAVCKVGWVPLEDVPDYIAAADLAIYPFDDNLVNRAKCSVKLVSLLAAGVPVVAEAVGQNAEYIIHGRTGVLVPSGDAEAMAGACVALLRDPEWRHSLGSAAAEEMASHYTWDVLAQRALAAYERHPESDRRS